MVVKLTTTPASMINIIVRYLAMNCYEFNQIQPYRKIVLRLD